MAPAPLRSAGMQSPVGPLWVACTPKGLAELTFGVAEAKAVARWRQRTGREVVRDEDATRPYVDELERYFAGETRRFRSAVDFVEGTAFQRRVWTTLLKIPYGETRSYKWLAEQAGAGKGFRAVGLANGRNPVPIVVPCHRVVNADGRIGGYSSGLDNKRVLLRLEGVLPDGPEGSRPFAR